MNKDELRAWLRLGMTDGVGNDAARKLLACFGSPQAVFEQTEAALCQVITPKQAQALLTVPNELAVQCVRTHHWLMHQPDTHTHALWTLGDAHYPPELLQLADRFVARISPRKTRRGQSVRAAVRAQYLDMQRQANPLGQMLVKQLGMYLPGSYVMLNSGEIAVVTRSTSDLKAPMVMAIVGKDGIPLSTPSVRDTAHANFAIKDAVSSDEVRVRLDPARLFGL